MIASEYAPTLTLMNAKKRAQMLQHIRAFFEARNIMEVTTPILSQAANTDVYIQSVQATFQGATGQTKGYLHTSPEFAMKRLLAAYQTPIYQICQVFRDNEKGHRHNIEFTMLEWYRPNFSLDALADELSELLSVVYQKPIHLSQISYAQAFVHYLGIHPFDDMSTPDILRQCAVAHNIHLDMGDDKQGWLDLLFSHLIEPKLGLQNPTLVINYPKLTAALAKTAVDADGYEIARRFELYINGVEIANAYDELANSQELLKRFEQDNHERRRQGLPIMPIDHRLLAACDHLPDCCGIALGIDRLFMVLQGQLNINQAIAITTDNA